MSSRKLLNVMLLVSMLTSLLVMGGVSPAGAQRVQSPPAAVKSSALAMPAGPTDESKVPHYSAPIRTGPYSPFTLPDVVVTIVGDGNGATATASVGANGAVTGITLTGAGSGYTAATVSITVPRGRIRAQVRQRRSQRPVPSPALPSTRPAAATRRPP